MPLGHDVQILICDDHPMTQDGFEFRLRQSDIFKNCRLVIQRASTGQEMLSRLEKFQPQCAIVDLGLPDIDGFELLKLIKSLRPSLPLLIVTGSQNTSLLDEVRQLGVAGIMHKTNSGERIALVLSEILSRKSNSTYVDPHIDRLLRASPGTPLSTREFEVLQFLGKGKKTPEIAQIMNVSVGSVRTYIDRISTKTGAVGLSELVGLYINGNFKRDLGSNPYS